MKALIFRNPWVAGVLAGVIGAACSWMCAQLFFEGVGGGARLGGMIVVGCIVGFSAALGVRSKAKKNSQSVDTESTE